MLNTVTTTVFFKWQLQVEELITDVIFFLLHFLTYWEKKKEEQT